MPTRSALRLPQKVRRDARTHDALTMLELVLLERDDAVFEDVNGPVLRSVLTLGLSAATTTTSLLLGLEVFSVLVGLLTGVVTFAASTALLQRRASALKTSTREAFLTDALTRVLGDLNGELLGWLENGASGENPPPAASLEWRWWLEQQPAGERDALMALVRDVQTSNTELTTREVLALSKMM